MEYYKQERRLQEKKHFQKEESPMKIIGAVGGLIGAGVTYFGARNRARESQAMLDDARGRMDSAMDVYASTDISNPFEGMKNEFAGMENQFAGMKNQFAGLENTMEDLTVNQQQAQFEAQQFQASQANIMDQMAQTAGGSGIAATVQALAQQGQLQAQQSAASIGAQESQNQAMAAQQASQLQQLQAQGAADVDLQQRQGAAAVDMASRKGAADVARLTAQGEQVAQQRELDRASTMLGMAQSEVAAYQQQTAQAQAQQTEALGGLIGGVGNLAGSLFSDRRLKKNIKLIGKSPSGLNIYLFEYINKAIGNGVYQGVMSNEIPKEAIVKHISGYDTVDYSKIDVEFKNII
tara:strand:- start:671 stop:1720 length:1050 start_codon:yes stop_codon:yes gene_type:complete